MHRLIFFYIALLLSLAVKGQNPDLLVGDWTYKDVDSSENLDSTKRANLKLMFGELRFSLKSDSNYQAMLFSDGATEFGKWSYDSTSKTLSLTQVSLVTGKKEKENKLPILRLTETTLVLRFARTKPFIFEKVFQQPKEH